MSEQTQQLHARPRHGQPTPGPQQHHWGPPTSTAVYPPPVFQQASQPHQIPQQLPGQTPQPPQTPKKKGGKTKWVVGGLAALLVIGMANNGNDTTTTTVAPVAAPAPAPAAAAPAASVPAVDTAAPTAPAAAAPAGEQPYNGYGQTGGTYGQEITAGGLAVTAQTPKTLSQEFIGSQTCATVSYRNTGTTSESFSPFDWKFRTAEGVETDASIPFNANKALNSGQLAPGGKVSGQVCADTQTTGVTSVVFSPGFGIMHEVAWTK